MIRVKAVLTLLIATFAGGAIGATYHITDDVAGPEFNSFFSYQNIDDPTHGRGNYVNQAVAQQKNLTYGHGDTFIVRVDSHTVVDPGSPGRDTVRLQSFKQFTQHVAVFNIWHLPQGCGTWPAIWEVGGNWPNNGEIDILEGVNDSGNNKATLHTNGGCFMPQTRQMTGTANGQNCDVSSTENQSCGVTSTDSRSYGPAFNNAEGGFYAIERTPGFIKIWFWSRQATNIPSDVLSGSQSVNTDSWGQPFALWPNTNCDLNQHVGKQNIIINIALCGDWAGSTFNANHCSGSCTNLVNSNPGAFANAYFDFQWMKIYQ